MFVCVYGSRHLSKQQHKKVTVGIVEYLVCFYIWKKKKKSKRSRRIFRNRETVVENREGFDRVPNNNNNSSTYRRGGGGERPIGHTLFDTHSR